MNQPIRTFHGVLGASVLLAGLGIACSVIEEKQGAKQIPRGGDRTGSGDRADAGSDATLDTKKNDPATGGSDSQTATEPTPVTKSVADPLGTGTAMPVGSTGGAGGDSRDVPADTPVQMPDQPPAQMDAPPANTIAELVASGQSPQLAFEVANADFEGPLWHPDGYLLVSEKAGRRILKWTPGAGAPVVFSDLGKKSNGLTFDAAGNLHACEDSVRTVARFPSTAIAGVVGKRLVVADKSGGKSFISPNDCVFDSHGALYFSDPWYGGAPLGGTSVSSNGVYRLAQGGAVDSSALLADAFVPAAGQESRGYEAGKGAPNGVAFSPDEAKLYVSSTGQNKILALSKQGSSYGNPTPFSSDVDLPDGLKVDAQGHLFVATTQGVTVLRADGSLMGRIPVGGTPSLTLSNMAFGGTNFKTLFMTSGNKVFKIELNVKGARPWQFTTHLPASTSL